MQGTDRQLLWEAECKTACAINPESNEMIWAPLRRTWFAPVTCLVYAAQLCLGGTWQRDVLWQLVNQSFNSYMNMSYSNASDSRSSLQLAAVALCSCGATVMARLTLSSPTFFVASQSAHMIAGRAACISLLLPPLAGNLVGNALNLRLTWDSNIREGAAVRTHPHGGASLVARSRIAGQQAFDETLLSRCLLVGGSMLAITALPALLLPRSTPQLQDWLADKTWRTEAWVRRALPRWCEAVTSVSCAQLRPHFPVYLPLYMLFVGTVLTGMLPLSLAPFQHYIQFEASELEPEIAAAAERGQIPNKLYIYRGF